MQSHAEPRPLVWFPGLLAALLTFGLTLPLWGILDKVHTVYEQIEIRELPLLTDWVIRVSPFLWIPALARIAYGYELILRDERDAAYRLFWSAVITLVFLHSTIFCALYYPLTQVPTV